MNSSPSGIILFCLFLGMSHTFSQDEFSGPQPGEPLPDCKIKVVFGPDKGNEIQLLQEDGRGSVAIFFVHEVTRPAIGLVRSVCNYAEKRKKDGLVTTIVFLTSDPTDTENWMNRAKRALPQGFNIGISPDGLDGPGAFGLNRKMQVTGIIARDKRVSANFAIVQPSIQADALKICQAIAKSLGDKKLPTIEEIGIRRPARNAPTSGVYEKLMRPFIQKDATDEQTKMRAEEIEKLAAKDPQLRNRIHEVANRIIKAKKLENYGTPKAQEYLKKWAREFTPNNKDK